MRLHGIHYDVGTETIEGSTTRPKLAVEEIERDIGDIAHGLHANAVRITGGDVGRLAAAGKVATREGLEVWLSPMIPNADPAATLALIVETAHAAEDLRRKGQARVVVVVGCELSVFMSGILPGATHVERFTLLSDPSRLVAEVTAAGIDPQASFAAFLGEAINSVRPLFHGQLTYAAGLWEEVDWSRFDMVGVDAYRDAANRDIYADRLRSLSGSRPVVITETGCATYRGAADAGGLAWTAVDRSAQPRRLRDGIKRDESGQATELAAVLDLAELNSVDGALIYTYIAPSYPSSLDPAQDLDAASFALVRSWPDGRTEPKIAYGAVAERYAKISP